VPTISIIVTTYNIEKYIDQCLASVAAQTIEDIEVLVVDDGSTDSTPAKIEAFAESDPRFRPVLLGTNSPGGVATGANAGLDLATAEWVGFVDGDDYIEPTMFEELLNAAETHDSDLAMCNYREVFEDTGELKEPADTKRWTDLTEPVYALDVETTRRFVRFIAVPWRKLYRRSLLEENQIRFPVVDYFWEDNPFHWFSLVSARDIAVVPTVLCYHRIGRGGQTMASADARLFKMFGHHDTIKDWLVARGLHDAYELSLLDWVISQAEWISARTPPNLRRELFDVLVPLFAQHHPSAVTRALDEGNRGARGRAMCDALVEKDFAMFSRVLEGRSEPRDYLRLGIHHLKHSGVRKTFHLTQRTVRDKVDSPRLEGMIARIRARSGDRRKTEHGDLMFSLMAVQQRLDRIEAALAEPTSSRSDDRPEEQ
jgi:glycosyltransferase involved in cell wall biosynthesis